MIRLFVLLLLTSTVAHAQPMTASELEPACRSALTATEDSPKGAQMAEVGACLGIVRTLIFVGPDLQEPNRFCPPVVSIEQAVRVLLNFIDSQPAALGSRFEIVAAIAFKEAWPCSAN